MEQTELEKELKAVCDKCGEPATYRGSVGMYLCLAHFKEVLSSLK